MCPFTSRLQFESKQNDYIDTLTLIPKEFEISFEFIEYGVKHDKQNIFHLTTGERYCEAGNMIPAVWMINGSLEVAMAINNTSNTSKLFIINDNEWHKVMISQKKNIDGDFIFQVVINDVVKWNVINQEPKEFRDVNFFMSNPWESAFSGSLRNFQICFKGAC